MGWQTVSVVQLFAGDTIINPSGVLVYSSAPAVGNLIASVAPANGTDQFGNHFVVGVATYAATFATSLQAGAIEFFSGSLAGGWSGVSSISGDFAGDVQVSANSGGLTLFGNTSVSITSGGAGGVSIQGNNHTQNGSNGGVTSGPSGTVNAFPAAGPNHTHAETHNHPY